ncbi:host specificity protein J [Haemophilus parainfluenzae]|uniref:host specificity protein J n=1 Tax=Haemophilus parainfluenzae TaxID=729 RepID=UPI00066CA72C
MGGKKGGVGGHTPVEAPDSLLSSQRLSAIGIISLGPIKGPVNKWKSTYLDNTPIQNASGKDDNDVDSFNFTNMEIQYTLGTQDQLPMTGFDSSQREVPIGIEVKKELPITRSIIDPDVDRLRVTIGVNALFSQNDQGDTNGASVEFEILINGNLYKSYSINGKSSSRFYRSYIIDELPPKPFNVTVRRVTADSKSQRLQNAIVWSSYTEIIDAKLSYPNIAMIGIKTDSRHTPNFPNVNSLLDGRIISVPSTYDPETRTYAPGIWRGDFKKAWTENPAWIFYDLATNPDVGIGKRISEYGLNKFQLYQIAQYCDELVPDGYGGKEPRMTAGIWITEQRSAYEVLNDMSSVFRAIVAWNGMQMLAIQDRPTDPVCTYSQANVIDGKFARQYVPLKSIYTAVEVEYADKNNMYQKAIEYVVDDEMVARYGYNVKKITAFACTSRGQARRYGKWVLVTSKLEQCTITFTVGREGLHHLPGDIIEVADNSWAKTNLGGRVIAINRSAVELDRKIKIEGDSYLSYVVRDNNGQRTERVKILSVAGNVVNLESVPENLNPDDNWALQTPLVRTELYRAIGISENDGNYTITALQHEPQKQAIVDNSASFESRNTTLHQAGVSAVSDAEVNADGSGISLSFKPPANFVGQGLKYQVKLYRNSNLFNVYDDLDQPSIAFSDLPDGDYIAEIRAKNLAGQLSEPITKSFSINFDIKELVTVSKVMGIDLNWRNPIFANTNAAIEIWVSQDDNFQHARKLVTLAYPTNSYSYTGLGAAETYYFWARMVSKDVAGKFTDAVEGVTERDATKIVDYIHGQINKSALTQELINEISGKSEAAEAAKDIAERAIAQIQQEAVTRGTQISELKTVDEQQAQRITTATAKAESALSGITAEQKARADGDKAEAQARQALAGRVANAEGSIANIRTAKADKSEVASIAQQSLRATWQADAQAKADKAKTDAVAQSKAEIDVVSRTVAGVNNKLSATHTIKTQVVGGGRTAIAGIALGASSDGKTAESSVIVMADKFGVVKNAADGTVQNVFTIADGNTALSGNIAVKGDVLGSRFIGGEIDISGKDGVLKVGRTGSFLMRASNQNRGLVMNNDQIIVYDERGVVRVKIGRLL